MPVCRASKCYEPLNGTGEAYCPVHLKEKRERDERIFDLAKKAAALTVIAAVSAKIIYDGLCIKEIKSIVDSIKR